MKSVKGKLIRFATKLSLVLLLVPSITQTGAALAVSRDDSTQTVETYRESQTVSSDITEHSTKASSEKASSNIENTLQGEFGSAHWEITDNHELLIFGGDFSETEGKSPWIDYKNQIEKIVLVEPVNAASESSDLFSGLTSLTEIQQIENLHFTEPTKINRMFAGDEALKKMDVHQWDTTNVVENEELFLGANALSEIHLGRNSIFRSVKETESQDLSKVWLDTASNESYPTLESLLSAYKGNKDQTFHYTDSKIIRGKIIIQFLDETDQPIHEDKEMSGTVGEAYDLMTENILPEIAGFTLNQEQLSEHVKGFYSEQPQTITLYYQKIDTTKNSSTQNEVNSRVAVPIDNPVISYSTHIESKGWQSYVQDGVTSGTTGENKRLEVIKIKVENANSDGTIQYRTHIQDTGWEGSFRANNAVSGTTGQAKQLEAVQIKLTGELAQKHDVYYRVHAQNIGWLGWAKNGDSAGTTGMAYQLEALQVKLVNKGDAAPGSTTDAFLVKPTISYRTHVQDIGWQGYQINGGISGTTGRAKALEAIQVKLENQSVSGSIQYRTHIRNIGWESSFRENNALSGTTGQAKPLEAIQIQLTGALSKYFDVYYRVHAQNVGWLGWAKNGASAGTTGMAYQLEALQVKLVNKGATAPGSTTDACLVKPTISYRTHVQDLGWQGYRSNGGISGTTGRAKALEAIQVKLENQSVGGSIQYRTHIRNIGWESSFRENNALSGTTGQAKPLEAIQIQLTGNLNKYFDVYYRVHAQNFGWLGWAKNGAFAGTEGYAYRLEGIQIKIQPKGASAPGSTANAFHKKTKVTEIVLGSVPYISQYTPVFAPWGCAGAAMAMLLRSKNVVVDLKQVQDNLPMYPQPGGQKGNVYTGVGFGWVITPAALTTYMRRWYSNVRNISGSDTNAIINTVLSGKPVLYYGYSSYQVVGDTVRNHCKVIAGYKDGKFLVYDPLYYSANSGPGTGGGNMNYDLGAQHWLPISNFNREYNRQAIVID